MKLIFKTNNLMNKRFIVPL